MCSAALDDKLPHPDQSFYEGLPFHGLKSPPKQVQYFIYHEKNKVS